MYISHIYPCNLKFFAIKSLEYTHIMRVVVGKVEIIEKKVALLTCLIPEEFI